MVNSSWPKQRLAGSRSKQERIGFPSVLDPGKQYGTVGLGSFPIQCVSLDVLRCKER